MTFFVPLWLTYCIFIAACGSGGKAHHTHTHQRWHHILSHAAADDDAWAVTNADIVSLNILTRIQSLTLSQFADSSGKKNTY